MTTPWTWRVYLSDHAPYEVNPDHTRPNYLIYKLINKVKRWGTLRFTRPENFKPSLQAIPVCNCLHIKTPCSCPDFRYGICLATLNGKLYAIGSSIEFFDANNPMAGWQPYSQASFSRLSSSCVAIGINGTFLLATVSDNGCMIKQCKPKYTLKIKREGSNLLYQTKEKYSIT